MSHKPDIPADMLSDWQRVVDLAADLVDVPASLVMKTDPPHHGVLVTSNGDDNPYEVGQSFELDSRLYCHAVLQNNSELIVRNAHTDPAWCDNQDLEHGMSFYIGYPLTWPDGSLFGTICVLDRQDNEKARLHRALLEEFRRVIEGDLALLEEAARRQRAEHELRRTLENLELRVAARTRALRRANANLLVRERELEDANTALRVLLGRMESSRQEFEEQISRQIKGLILPHIVKLRRSLPEHEPGRASIDLVEANLQMITSSFAQGLVSAFQTLTPTEIEILQMVTSGRTTKDIARALSREVSTIDFHRNNIRKKLGIERRTNLRTYLLSLA